MDVKHGGCFDCGSTEQEILESVMVLAPKMQSIAVCRGCKAKREAAG
jgi:hypothetical protein